MSGHNLLQLARAYYGIKRFVKTREEIAEKLKAGDKTRMTVDNNVYHAQVEALEAFSRTLQQPPGVGSTMLPHPPEMTRRHFDQLGDRMASSMLHEAMQTVVDGHIPPFMKDDVLQLVRLAAFIMIATHWGFEFDTLKQHFVGNENMLYQGYEVVAGAEIGEMTRLIQIQI